MITILSDKFNPYHTNNKEIYEYFEKSFQLLTHNTD